MLYQVTQIPPEHYLYRKMNEKSGGNNMGSFSDQSFRNQPVSVISLMSSEC